MIFHDLVNKTTDPNPPVDKALLERDYFQFAADAPGRFINFGTKGHRGTSLDGTFTEAHVFAITQAICDYRRSHNITGPLFLGCSTHYLSRLAQRNVIETLAGNDVQIVLQENNGVTPSPVISWAVLVHNRRRRNVVADGIILAPSDDSPESGGIRYHSPEGPADRLISKWIQDRANELFRDSPRGIKRALFSSAIRAASTHEQDFVAAYTGSLDDVLDLNSIRAADLSLAVDPKAGATLPYWERIRDTYRLKITLLNSKLDHAFTPPDPGRSIRADCSHRHGPANRLAPRDRYAVSCENSPTGELNGIVARGADSLRTNDFLAVAVQYLLNNRPVWPRESVVAKTFLTSALIDRVVHQSNRRLAELPGGFHWFTPGLLDATICFGANECGGATFLCKDGIPWTTERDAILLTLLAAEITARTGNHPAAHYRELVKSFGNPYRTSIDVPVTAEQKERLNLVSAKSLLAAEVAGEPVLAKFTRAPGNNESLGGLKMVTANGWFAISTPEFANSCKLSAESFLDQSHLDALVTSARQIIEKIASAAIARERSRTGHVL